MPAVLSTPAGATVIFLSSTWPHSLHSSSNKMTFWSDFLSALAQLMLLTSSTFLTTAAAAIEFNNNFQTSTTITVTSSSSPSSSSSNSFSIAYPSNASFQHGNSHSSDALKRTINHVQHRYSSDRMRDEDDDESGGDGGGGTSIAALAITNETMFNLTTTTTIKPQQSPSPEASSSYIGASHYSNLTVTAAVVTDSALSNKNINNLVDCNDFTEQKLLNIVICAISDVNSNVINGTISADNSTFGSGNDTLRNISDEFGRFYNASDGSDITGNNNETLNHSIKFEPSLSFIQVITTAVVLGVIILATVIGE